MYQVALLCLLVLAGWLFVLGVHWNSLPGHLREVFYVCPFCGWYVTPCCSWALTAIGMSVVGIKPQADWLYGLVLTIVNELYCQTDYTECDSL